MSDCRVAEIKDNHIATRHPPKGISLVEMALFIGVIGLFLQAGAQIYRLNNINDKTQTTNTALVNAREALNTYYFKNQRLPCPASRIISQDATTYGTSVKTSHTRRPDPDPDLEVYDCSVDAGVAVATAADGRDVQIGALPIKELGLQPGADLDSFGHRLVYAVTSDYTTSDAKDVVEGAALAADMGDGAITIHDSQGRPATSTDGNVVFTVIAPGKDDRGAYNSNGKLVKACDTTPGVLASENCDDDATFVSTTIRSEAVVAQAFSNKLVYAAGKSVPSVPVTNPACQGGNLIGDVAFLIDGNRFNDDVLIRKHRHSPPGPLDSVTHLALLQTSLAEVIPELLEQKKLDSPPNLVGMLDFSQCNGMDNAGVRKCIYNTNGGFPEDQALGTALVTIDALENAKAPAESYANGLDETEVGRPLYRKMIELADAVGEGPAGRRNNIVVLIDGRNSKPSGMTGGRNGTVEYLATNYPNLNFIFIKTGSNDSYFKALFKGITRNRGGVKKTFKLKGYYVSAPNVDEYKIAIKNATICH